MRLALAGDVILTRDLTVERDAGVDAVAEVLRGADCTIANLEMPLHDFRSPAAPAAGGLWMGAAPERARDIAWMGIMAMSRANNHAGDYGLEGMLQTDAALAAVGIAHAGTGLDLDEARRATYLETAAGVVALISCTSTFPLGSMAGRARPPIPGRPGVSPLRRAGDRLVDPAEAMARTGLSLAEMRELRSLLGLAGAPGPDTAPISPQDAGEVLAEIESARATADVVVVAIHSHDQGRLPSDPSRAIVDFARTCIDSGADVVAVHGVHQVRGVEMNRGRPVLHGLGSLFFQPETVPHLPDEAFRLHGLPEDASVADLFARRWSPGRPSLAMRPETWQGVIAKVQFAGGQSDVELMPIDLRMEHGAGRRGTPRPRSW